MGMSPREAAHTRQTENPSERVSADGSQLERTRSAVTRAGRRCFSLALAFACALVPGAAAAEPRRLEAVRTDTPPTIDGRLDEPAWQTAHPTGDLVQLSPVPGGPALYPTEIRLLYDDEALYIGAFLDDPEPDRIVARLARRDSFIDSDWFQVGLDSRHDHRSGFRFAVNAGGLQVDGTYQHENQVNFDWDGVWQSAVRIERGARPGWVAELRLPLKLLRFQPGPDVHMGLNFSRTVSRHKQVLLWQLVPPDTGQFVSLWGDLTGLALERAPLALTLIPYAALRAPVTRGASVPRVFDVGGDAIVGLGDGFHLTLSANPDFGQVEVDEVVLNLTTIETYYPEKRPFFLEDRSLFELDQELFYTRRIGQSGRRSILQEGEQLVRPAPPPRIFGALKLTGETEGRLALGLIQAVTSEEEALIRDTAGKESLRTAESLTSFSVLRLRQGFGDHSSIGAMATAAVSDDTGAAVTAGTDLSLDLLENYRIGATALMSYVSDGRMPFQDSYVQAALRRDGPFGYGARLDLAKVGGEHLVGEIEATYYSANLALNDMGYLDRADRMMVITHLIHHRLKPLGPLQSYSMTLSGWIDRSTAMVNLGDGGSLDVSTVFLSGWSSGAWLFSAFPLCDDRETRTGGEVVICGGVHRWNGGLWLITDSRLPLTGNFELRLNRNERGFGLIGLFRLDFHMNDRITLSLGPDYSRQTGSIRWIGVLETPGGDRHLFAVQHSETWSILCRLAIVVRTSLTLQLYAQAFLAAVDREDKLSAPVPSGRAIGQRDLQAAPDVPDDYDFSTSSLNASALVRFEPVPGTVAYLVYTLGSGLGAVRADFRFGDTLPALLHESGEQALMIKLSVAY